MTNPRALVSALLLLVLNASAVAHARNPFQAVQEILFRQSPLGQHLSGVDRTGAHGFAQSAQADTVCVGAPLALMEIPKGQPLNPARLLRGTSNFVDPATGISHGTALWRLSMMLNYKWAFEFLRSQGDGSIHRRYVCYGLFDFGVKNAFSAGMGYILFDPRFIIATRVSVQDPAGYEFFAYQQAQFHEFAHQLQYWNGDAFQDDPTHRRTELVADCVGAALHRLKLRADAAGGFANAMTVQAAESSITLSAVRSGDFYLNSTTHHGTPTERLIMSRYGVRLVENYYTGLRPAPANLTASGLLGACTAHVRARDQRYGAPWPVTTISEL